MRKWPFAKTYGINVYLLITRGLIFKNFNNMNIIFRTLLNSDELKKWMVGVKRSTNKMYGLCYCWGPMCHYCNPGCPDENSAKCDRYRMKCNCRAGYCPCQVGCPGFGSDQCVEICKFSSKCYNF